MRKVLLTISLVFILIFSSHSESLDYLSDLDLNAFNKRYEKIKNFNEKIAVTQNELKVSDVSSFKDGTTINKVSIDKNDKKRNNKISITIDDNFSDKYTSDILDVLDKHNCKATFFITYKLLIVNPKRVFEIISRGHEIANHSMTHPPFKRLHPKRKEWELSTLNDWVHELTNVNMCLCRFPTGSYDAEAVNIANKCNLYPIGWSIDTKDWKLKNADKIYNYTISQNVETGDIVLLHNGYSYSKELFDKLLTYYEDKGYTFLKVSDLIYTDNFIVEKGIQKHIN